jgi:4-carboxymuconolactone decarboxylase
MEMRLLAATVLPLALLAGAPAHAQGGGASASLQEPRAITISPGGSQPSRGGPAENFTGAVRVDPLFGAAGPSHASASSVTFEAGARSAWHTHPRGQVLVVTAGAGRVQSWGGPIQEMRQGDVVRIAAGKKHWHGASPTTAVTHIAIQEHRDGEIVAWMEKVTDVQYAAAVQQREPASALPPPAVPGETGQPTPAQRLIGDLAPKLVELTDDVLFGDVWARPELSPRDRSLVTVSALIAMNRPDQLRSHLARARENGVRQDELIEAITHLAFYAGWPSAMTAITVARDVFQAN